MGTVSTTLKRLNFNPQLEVLVMQSRTQLKTIWSLLLLSLATMLMSGCMTDQAAQQATTVRSVWPPPPDQPRIEWIRSFYAQEDFPKSSFEVFKEVIVGKTKGISFRKPIDVKSDGKGLVYVTDIQLAGIFRFDMVNQKYEFWRRGDDPDTSLAITPYFISLDSSGNLYAVGTGRKEVYVVNGTGDFLRKFSFSPHVANPGGILVDSAAKRIYLVDNSGSKVAIFDLEGKYISSFGKPGEKDGEFNRPSPIAMNSKGEIIVGDVLNARIQIFDRDGRFLRKFGERGDGAHAFQIMKSLAVDSDDNIYVTDGKANQLKIFNVKGEWLMSFGKAYSVTKTMKESPGGFLLPQGISIDSTDSIYVVDQANMRFQMFKYLKDEPKKAADSPMKEK